MKPRSFFMIVVRIIGLFLLINLFTTLPMAFSLLSTMRYDGIEEGAATVLITFIVMLVAIVFSIVYFLLIKPEKIVKSLKLDTGFEEEKFELNFSQSSILKISIIIIGGITLLNEIPKFIVELFAFWRQKRLWWVESPETKFLLLSGITIIISYFLIYYNEEIVQFIKKNNKKA